MRESPELVSRSATAQRLEQLPIGAPPLDVLKLNLESTQCRDGVPPIGLELRNESTARFRDRLPEASQLGIPGARLSRVEPERRVALLQCATVAHPLIDEPRFHVEHAPVHPSSSPVSPFLHEAMRAWLDHLDRKRLGQLRQRFDGFPIDASRSLLVPDLEADGAGVSDFRADLPSDSHMILS